ncbi:unnamed protein product [Moneuplotes crassus]|uniref:CSC1/OSCA1-like cytosolic domain-containing protein n=3 Tax=Euplotes crassus TaxID=5936 RepID=A0AAD1XZY0_EUPCR|nr:unnamed protein product [Moneuplotes crassus]
MEEDLKVKELDALNEDVHEKQNESHSSNKEQSGKTNHPGDEDIDSDDPDLIEDILDQIPPDFELAEKHRDANRVKNIRDEVTFKNTKSVNKKEDFCPCCQMPTSKSAPLFSLCTNVFNLEDLGCGFPLYYEYKKFIFGIFIAIILIFSITALVFNTNEGKASQWVEGKEPSNLMKLSLGNYGAVPSNYEGDELIIQAYLNFGAILVILILENILRRRQNILVKKIDEKNITPPDFTVYAMNLPLDKSQEQVKEWFENYDDELKLKVSKINYCYDIKESVKLSRELDKWQKMQNYVLHYREQKCNELNITEEQAEKDGIDINPPRVDYDYFCIKETFPTFEEIAAKVEQLEKQFEELRNEMDVDTDKDLYIGKAFITLERQQQATRLAKIFEMHYIIRAVFFLYYRVFKCKQVKIEKRFWDGKRIIIERAADPVDVYWENLSVKDYQRLVKTLITYSITAILLCFVFGIYFSLNIWKEDLEDNASNSNKSGEIWTVRVVSFGTSILAIFINSILKFVIRKLSSYEKHMTYTKYHLSVAFKLTIATFVNVALLPIFTRLEKEEWFESGGLSTTIFYNVVSVSFVAPIVNLFNISYLIKRIKMCREKRKGEKSKLTQRQANQLFLGPNMDIASAYSNTCLLFLVVSFYTPIMPILPMVAGAGVLLQYWVEKYLLLRRYSIPEAAGSAMANFYANVLPFGMFLYALSNYLFLNELSDHENQHGQWALWFMIAYIVLPVRLLLNLFTDSIEKDGEMTYESRMTTFINDYDRSNPMTSNEARREFLLALKTRNNAENKEQNDEDDKEIDDELQKLEGKNKLQAILMYGKAFKSLEHKQSKFDKISHKKGYKHRTRDDVGARNLFKIKCNNIRNKKKNGLQKFMGEKLLSKLGRNSKKSKLGKVFPLLQKKDNNQREVPLEPRANSPDGGKSLSSLISHREEIKQVNYEEY